MQSPRTEPYSHEEISLVHQGHLDEIFALTGAHERPRIFESPIRVDKVEEILRNANTLINEPDNEERQGSPEEIRAGFQATLKSYIESVKNTAHQRVIEYLTKGEGQNIFEILNTTSDSHMCQKIEDTLAHDPVLSALFESCDHEQHRYIINALKVLKESGESGLEFFLTLAKDAEVKAMGGMGLVIFSEGKAYKILLEQNDSEELVEQERSKLASNVRFLREILIGLHAKHPNVLGISDVIVGKNGEILGYQMNIVNGPELNKVDLHKLPLQYILWIMLQAFKGVDHIHQFGVIHRDLKPENMMLDFNSEPSERLKVLDMGISRSYSSDVQIETPEVTDPGSCTGTVHYMSPEQTYGKSLTKQSDLYTLGVILHEALTGKLPYTRQNANLYAMLQTVAYGEREINISGVREAEKVAEELDAFIRKLLKKDPNERHDNAEEAYAELVKIYYKLYHADKPTPTVRANHLPLPPEPPIAELTQERLLSSRDPELAFKDTLDSHEEEKCLPYSRKVAFYAHVLAAIQEKYNVSFSTLPKIENPEIEINQQDTTFYPNGSTILSQYSFDERTITITEGEALWCIPNQQGGTTPIMRLGIGATIGGGEKRSGSRMAAKGQYEILGGNGLIPKFDDLESHISTSLSQNFSQVLMHIGITNPIERQRLERLLASSKVPGTTFPDIIANIENYGALSTSIDLATKRSIMLNLRNIIHNPYSKGTSVQVGLQKVGTTAEAVGQFLETTVQPQLLSMIKSALKMAGQKKLDESLLEEVIEQLPETFNSLRRADLIAELIEYAEKLPEELAETKGLTEEKIKFEKMGRAEVKVMEMLHYGGEFFEIEDGRPKKIR